MPNYEYKVVPAPKKGLKGKGIKGADARFANAMMVVMNDLGTEGWEYQRSDTLPCEERIGLRGRNTTFQNMLVFRREVIVEATAAMAGVMADTVIQEAAPVVVAAAVATETIANTHAPLLNGAMDSGNNTAPALGPATDDAVEVKDPRTDLAQQ